jgi:adenosylmethionine-8-amino-7-oxononanoate aminotransferase
MAGGGFTHGFTYSHHAVGAAVAREVLRILETESLVDASQAQGERLQAELRRRLDEHPHLGEIRGRGLMVGIELVADREARAAFPRSAKVTEAIVRAARDAGVLVYAGTGLADGRDGDSILLGPPFVVTDGEIATIAEVVTNAVDAATGAAVAAAGP